MTLPNSRSGSVVVFLAALASVGVYSAQTPAPQRNQDQRPPVFRGGATFVNVDVYPRRDGKFVEGLTAADFQVFEDGKPQAVEAFELIRFSPITPNDERRDPSSVEDSLRQAADPRNRVFVVYLDPYHVGMFDSQGTRWPIMDFLTRTIGPTDLFAVMTPEMPVSGLTFGRSLTAVSEQLAKFSNWGTEGPGGNGDLPRTTAEERLYQCYGPDRFPAVLGIWRADVLFSSLEALVGYLGTIREERKGVLFFTGRLPLPKPTRRLPSAGRGAPPAIGVGPGGRIGIGASQDPMQANVSWCDAQVARVGLIDYDQRFRDLLLLSRRANVTFYPVDPGGLRVARTPDTLLTLAENTDGIAVVNTNDIRTPVRLIADSLAAYYLLGYYSTNQASDGRYRQIEVKVKQPDVRVTARRGYLAPTAAMRRAEEASMTAPAKGASPAEDELGRLARLRPDAQLYGYGIPSGTGLEIVTEIANTEIAAGRWKTGATVTLAVASPEAGATPVNASGRIEAGARSAILRVPLDRAPTGVWKVVAHVESDDGRLEETFDIAAAPPSRIGGAVAFRGGPAARAPMRPVADFQFRRTERLHVEWRRLQPADDQTARVLNRRGEALALSLVVTERPDPAGAILATDLPLSALPEGDYVIEVAVRSGEITERRMLAFRVVR